MSRPDLHIVSDNESPRRLPLSVDTYSFARTELATFIFRNGVLIDTTAAAGELLTLLRDANEKQEQMLSEIASTPGGLG